MQPKKALSMIGDDVLDHMERLRQADQMDDSEQPAPAQPHWSEGGWRVKTISELDAAAAPIANMLYQAEHAKAEDMVTMPHHYARFKIEPMHFIAENGLNWFQGNILKYILRHDAKNGMEDLRKARRYLDMFIKFVDGDVDWWRRPAEAATVR